MSDSYEGMSYIKAKTRRLHYAIVNSNFWFHLYYKHTKDFKKQLAEVEARAIASRKSILGVEMKLLCKKDYQNKGIGGGGFEKGKYYDIESLYKNPNHELMINFSDMYYETLQLSLREAETVFDFTKGTDHDK